MNRGQGLHRIEFDHHPAFHQHIDAVTDFQLGIVAINRKRYLRLDQ